MRYRQRTLYIGFSVPDFAGFPGKPRYVKSKVLAGYKRGLHLDVITGAQTSPDVISETVAIQSTLYMNNPRMQITGFACLHGGIFIWDIGQTVTTDGYLSNMNDLHKSLRCAEMITLEDTVLVFSLG